MSTPQSRASPVSSRRHCVSYLTTSVQSCSRAVVRQPPPRTVRVESYDTAMAWQWHVDASPQLNVKRSRARPSSPETETEPETDGAEAGALRAVARVFAIARGVAFRHRWATPRAPALFVVQLHLISRQSSQSFALRTQRIRSNYRTDGQYS